jgi:hypothetical protein
MIEIDGIPYQVPVVSITRTADVLDKFAERTENGVLHREIIGVYFNYKMKIGIIEDRSDYEAFWNKISEPVEFHTIVIYGTNGNYTFVAYVANMGDELRLDDNGTYYWQNTTVDFIAQVPARTP